MLVRLPCSCVLAAAAALTLSCTGRAHVLEEGTYAFTEASVVQDDCGLAGPSGALWDADYAVAGHVVMMKYALYGMNLDGFYLSKLEEFVVDGSASNFYETLHGTECLVDRVTVHLEATTDGPTAFHGGLQIRYESSGPPACSCELWTTYTAVKK